MFSFIKGGNLVMKKKVSMYWVSDCCLMPNEHFFIYHDENKLQREYRTFHVCKCFIFKQKCYLSLQNVFLYQGM